MINPAQHSILILGSNLRMPIFALALVCALTMFVTQPLQAQTFSVIHDFSGADGYGPYGGLTLDAAGNLYGTTSLSTSELGTVLELKRSHGNWILNSLFAFTGNDGSIPYGGVVFGPDGALYG